MKVNGTIKLDHWFGLAPDSSSRSLPRGYEAESNEAARAFTSMVASNAGPKGPRAGQSIAAHGHSILQSGRVRRLATLFSA
ncbi:hypothetical protein [Bradyrhizobium macuxiense]|uniref:hypothetical protein n=1 Tax=Bradyrhizobium macuxiense TaxID=1755647 RepID=UPI0011BFCBA1|nr:hypothetical protein [Bradyrhizobium macuxiense]